MDQPIEVEPLGNGGVIDGEEKVEEISNPHLNAPQAGMTFSSEKELYDFFNSYAREKGFSVFKMSTKSGDDGRQKYYSLACHKFGSRRSNKTNTLNAKPSKKTGCKAKINVRVDTEESFTILRVFLDHNHALSPRKARYFPCNRTIDSHLKKRLELNDEAGIPLNKNFHSLVVEAGGYENLSFVERDCRNYILKARQMRLGVGDAEALQNYFLRMQKRNSRFFYTIDMDEEGRLRNVFWADARLIAAYESFSDVISFDSTYLTNKYDMPFAPFVGVNHHGQTILLGCGLLSNEDIDAYVWLFSSWLQCMSGRHPKAIVTDQCKAIEAAIAKVFPHSHHRFCLWHIMRKIPEKLGGLAKYKEVKKILKMAVYESVGIDEFEKAWNNLIEDYKLEDNGWLNSLYEVRQRWVPVYIKNIFWAGMSSTQRSEGINAFFDGYVGVKTSLKQFVEQYDHALKKKIENENKADFASFNSTFPVITSCDVEKQFQAAYTNDIFKLFQNELIGMFYCNLEFVAVDGSISKFLVKDFLRDKEGNFKRQVTYEVYFNETEFDIKCSCCLFEFKGILCRHVVKVLIEKKVKEVPSQYILDRWRKDIKRTHNFVTNCYDDFECNEKNKRYNKLCSIVHKIVEIGAESNEKYECLIKCMDEVQGKLISMDTVLETKEGDHQVSSTKVLSPLKSLRKGRPRSTRMKSTMEKIEKLNKHSQGSQNLKKKRKASHVVTDQRRKQSKSTKHVQPGTEESLMYGERVDLNDMYKEVEESYVDAQAEDVEECITMSTVDKSSSIHEQSITDL